MKPKLNLIYYKNILDRCFCRFFEENGNLFTRNGDRYVFAGSLSKASLEKTFRTYMDDELGKYVKGFSDTEPEYFFVIGSCIPGENILLQMDPALNNSSAQTTIRENPDLRYFLKEDDIDVDTRLFNRVFEDIFRKMMKNSKKRNVFFIRHNLLDCWFLFKIFKERYHSMVVNLHKKNNLGDDRCIFSANEKLDSESRKKTEILKDPMLNPVKEEIWRFIDDCMENA